MLFKLEFIIIGIILAVLSILVITKKVITSKIKYFCLLPIPVLIYFGFGFWHIWVTDDAFITFRVVRNFLSGLGPIFNIGERVEVYTHPLWMGILSFWDFMTGEIELGAAWLGLFLSVSGLFLGQWGAVKLLQKTKNAQKLVFIPFGSLIIVALPPFWEYASSGLETGLGFFWLSMAFFLLARSFPKKSQWSLRIMLMWFSLGPLIRPDFVIFSLGLVLLTFAIYFPKSVRDLVSFGMAATFLPGFYQIFRMGYFASLYPNPALARSALSSYWSQGIIYLKDFILPYKLYLPLTITGLVLIMKTIYELKKHQAKNVTITSTFAGLGLLYAFFIIQGGGDFMHGRFLLPSVLALQLPISCLVLSRNRSYRCLEIALFSGIVIWMSWCIGWGRIPYKGIGPYEISNEHAFHTTIAGKPNPITLSDYGMKYRSKYRWITIARKAGRRESPYKTIISNINGRRAQSAGPNFYIYLNGALADPIASRFLLQCRGRPGHEKFTPRKWMLARLKDDKSKKNTFDLLMNSQAYIDVNLLLTKKLLESPPISDLLEAIHAPLNPARFFHNILLAWQTRNLKIPKNPSQALLELCSPIPSWIDTMLSLDSHQKVLTLKKNIDPAESHFKSSFINPGHLCHNNKLIFEFKPIYPQFSFIIQLFIEESENKIYVLSYALLSNHSKKFTPIVRGSKATFFLCPINQPENWYCIDLDIRKELQKIFGKHTRFHCLRRITFRGNSKYLLVKRFHLNRNR